MGGSIYVHIPFCKSKCLYCAFYSVANAQWHEPFLNAVCREIELTKDYLPGKEIDTLYFGGGTPSLFPVRDLERVVRQLQKFYHFSDELEWTMEANPEQLTPTYLSELRHLGINRLSIGVQSFQDDILRILRRGHTAQEAQSAVENAERAGFDNISVDLIYDIAFRTGVMWEEDVRRALSLPIRHLSAYSLTVEENTLLARRVSEGRSFVIDDRDSDRDYVILKKMTEAAGFEQYEISNFAKLGAYSRHNSAYWTGQPYLGLGPAAHSFRSPVRQWNVADIRQYVEGMDKGMPVTEQETLTLDMQYDEFVLLRLRTKEGLSPEDVFHRFGADYAEHLYRQLERVPVGHYRMDEGHIKLTREGQLLADAIAAELFI